MKTMNIKLSTLLCGTMALFASCSEFKYNEDYAMTEDVVWADSYVSAATVLESLYAVYGPLNDGYNDIMGFAEAVTDNAASNLVSNTDADLFNSGTFTATNNPDDAWTTYYGGIYLANRFLTLADKLLSTESFVDDNGWTIVGGESLSDTNRALLELYCAEAKVLKAFYYTELMRRYGAVPIIAQSDATADAFDSSVNEITIPSVAELVAEIVSISDEAYNSGYLATARVSGATMGRVTTATALAVKSRAYMIAASLDTANKSTYFQSCIDVSMELVPNLACAELDTYADLANPSNSTHSTNTNEVILERRGGGDLTIATANYPIGFELGEGNINPTQNLVEAYYKSYMGDMDASLRMSGSTPYSEVENDPRFAATIIYNGSTFNSRTIELNEDGADATSAFYRGSTTGYYLRKFVHPTLNLVTGSETNQNSWFLMRYAEVYFNLMEAIYGLNGDHTTVDATAGVSAQALLNTLRSVRGYSDTVVIADAAEFLSFLRNERRVEFAFEGMYYFDVKRWYKMDGYTPSTTVSGVTINSRSSRYTVDTIEGETRFNYLSDYPLPDVESLNDFL